MNRADKQSEIEFLTDAFSKSAIAVCADYRGLTVSEIGGLRSELKKAGSTSRVVKNTLAKVAVGNAYSENSGEELEKFVGLFQGPNFVVFSEEDPVAPAKIISKFAKDHKNLEVKGAWFEGSFVDVDGVKELSAMPSKEEILAKLLNLMNAPATQLLQVMQAPSREVVQVLEAQRAEIEKKG
jgi:large subunit ribosomal protein L10